MVFQAGQGELTAKINADASGFRSGIASATQALGGFRGAVGIASGAVVAFAGAQGLGSAIQSAAQFEEQMLSLRATVGESAETVQDLRGDVMDLAAETGQSTGKIVDGFRFARSAGLDMAEAQELVETATKASAAGFGEQSELVRTATTAMNAWSEEVESGSEFLDTMTAAAQNADIRVSDLASAFRRNINMASNLGLTLEETLSSLSAISGAVGSASRGGRLLQQTFNGLLSPSGQAADAISDVFGSVDQMRRSLQKDGLLDTLLQLQDGLQNSGRGMEDVFRSSRKLEGVLAQLAEDGARTREIMGELGDNTGNVEDAFNDTEGTLRKWRKTQQRFNNLMITFGTNILPPVNDALDSTANFFSTISGNVQNVSGVIESDLMRSLQNIENMRVGPPEVAESNANLITPEQFDEIESSVQQVMTQLERSDAPEELRKNVETKLNAAVNSGFLQGLSGPEIVNRVEGTAEQMSGVIERETKQGVEDGAKQAEIPQIMQNYMDNMDSPLDLSMQEEMRIGGEIIDISAVKEQNKKVEENFEQSGAQSGREYRDAFERNLESLTPLARNVAMDMNRAMEDTFFNAMQGEFDDLGDAAESFGRNLARNLSRTMSQNLSRQIMGGLLPSGGGGGMGIGDMAGNAIWEIGSILPFGDTPGVQEVGSDGQVTAFAPGDKFAAAQSMEDLRAQVGAGKQSQGPNINQSTTVQFNVEAVDAESVSRLFQQRSDELAGIITDNIDRRGQVKQAIEGATR